MRDNKNVYMSTSFHIASEKFVGPIELLLQLVRKRKLHVSEIALSEVAESFLEHFRAMPDMPLHHSTHFLGVTAVLVYVKSQALLPDIQPEEDADAALSELAGRVSLYAIVQDMLPGLREVEGFALIIGQKPRQLVRTGYQPDPSVTGYRLHQAAKSLLSRNQESLVETRKKTSQVIKPRLALERVFKVIRESILSTKHPATLSSLIILLQESEEGGCTGKDALIGGFLAALEMVREDAIHCEQAEGFAEITIYPR